MTDSAMTPAQLVDRLQQQGHGLDADAIHRFLATQAREKEMPLYLRALIGVGAFIASLFFLAFLGVANLIDFESIPALLIWGTLFGAAAVGILALARPRHGVGYSFFLQASFCVMAMGKSLIVLGLTQMLQNLWAVPLAALLVTVVSYPVYQLSLDRFLSVLAVLIGVLLNLLWNMEDFQRWQALLLVLFVAGHLFAAGGLLTHGRVSRAFMPTAYAVVVSLCAYPLLAAFLFHGNVWGGYQDVMLPPPWLMKALFTTALLITIAWAAGSVQRLRHEPLLVAMGGALLLGILAPPGLVLAIGLLILGYAKHDRILLNLGLVLLPAFIFLFYYSLQLTLMAKAGVLIGSGLLLLGGYFYLRPRGIAHVR